MRRLTSGEQPVPPTASTRGHRRRAAALALAVVALAVLAGGAWAWYVRARDRRPTRRRSWPCSRSRRTGAAPDTAFADGLGDAITGKLARLQGLRVIDRASVRTVKDAARLPQAAGHALGADYVLRATLRWARGADGQPRVQVSPVLVRVADGTTKWAGEPTVVTPSDPFAAQGALATEVAEALDVALAPAERARLARPATTDTAAFAARGAGPAPLASRVRRDPAGPGSRRCGSSSARTSATRSTPTPSGRRRTCFSGWRSRGAPRTFYDSAAVLARRALALDPGQMQAVNALGVARVESGSPQKRNTQLDRAGRAGVPVERPAAELLEARARS